MFLLLPVNRGKCVCATHGSPPCSISRGLLAGLCCSCCCHAGEWVSTRTYFFQCQLQRHTSCNKFWCGSFFSIHKAILKCDTLSQIYSYIYHICYFRIVCLSIFTMYVWICHFWIMLVGWLKMGIIFQKYDYIHAPSTEKFKKSIVWNILFYLWNSGHTAVFGTTCNFAREKILEKTQHKTVYFHCLSPRRKILSLMKD